MNPSDFDSIRPGSVILRLDAAGPAEIVQVTDFGPTPRKSPFGPPVALAKTSISRRRGKPWT